MKRVYFFLLFILFVNSVGCSSHRRENVTQGAAISPLKQARVFQKDKFAKGGNILIVPFSAGANVSASDDLDHVSLMIVRGIADVLGSEEKPFKVLVRQDAQDADIVIKGRILQMDLKKNLKKPWAKRVRKLTLEIEGSVLAVEPEEILAKFSQIKKSKSKADSLESMGYVMGTEIGQFLLSNAR